MDSLKAGCTGLGECRRSEALLDDFYDEYSEPEVRSQLEARYNASTVRALSRDKLVDLYLYTYTEPGSPERHNWGYDTDYYFGFTTRDLLMWAETARWVGEFFRQTDDCEAVDLVTHYEFPGDPEIVSFLKVVRGGG